MEEDIPPAAETDYPRYSLVQVTDVGTANNIALDTIS